ncbi:MAG: hypothetical protein ACT6FF_10070 [Methanosarcinaceae archaeon]
MKFNIILEKAEEVGYNAKVPALNVFLHKRKLLNVKEAIACYLEGLEKVNQIKI